MVNEWNRQGSQVECQTNSGFIQLQQGAEWRMSGYLGSHMVSVNTRVDYHVHLDRVVEEWNRLRNHVVNVKTSGQI